MKTLAYAFISLLVITGFSCGSETESEPEFSKTEAAAQDGKSDHFGDICEVMGWYGDGECDTFCSKLDVDDCDIDCDDNSQPNRYCASPQPCTDGLIQAKNNGCQVCVDPNTCELPVESCDDGSAAVSYCASPQPCTDGLVEARIQGCKVCVDPNTCELPVPSCDDDSIAVNFCASPQPCTDGLVQARKEGCQVCVDPNTCELPVESCDDDSVPADVCASPEPCTDGLVQARKEGCQVCVDPNTCEVPTTGNDLCGGIAGLTCSGGQVCINEPGTCNVADGAGECITAGEFCPAVILPVCGCDGVTYNNSCRATQAGASIDYDGACRQ